MSCCTSCQLQGPDGIDVELQQDHVFVAEVSVGGRKAFVLQGTDIIVSATYDPSTRYLHTGANMGKISLNYRWMVLPLKGKAYLIRYDAPGKLSLHEKSTPDHRPQLPHKDDTGPQPKQGPKKASIAGVGLALAIAIAFLSRRES